MEYLQYLDGCKEAHDICRVLNLIINGIPSIRRNVERKLDLL